jgi:nitrogen fixation NifU-like protein
MSDVLYKEIILEHWKNPHNYGELKNADIDALEMNELCGDEIRIMAKIKNGKIEKITFTARGCSIAKAGGSILTDLVTGKSIKDIKKITPEKFLKEIGVEFTPARTKCALLGLETLQKALI